MRDLDLWEQYTEFSLGVQYKNQRNWARQGPYPVLPSRHGMQSGALQAPSAFSRLHRSGTHQPPQGTAASLLRAEGLNCGSINAAHLSRWALPGPRLFRLPGGGPERRFAPHSELVSGFAAYKF